MIEAAIVTLPFFLFVFAVMEVGLQMASSHAVTAGVKAGSRTASTAVTDPQADHTVLQAVRKELSGLPRGEGQIQRIVIYKSTSTGQGPPSACTTGTTGVAGVCNVYDAADLKRPDTDFGCTAASSPDRYWCPTVRKTALTDPPDFIGIYIETTHQRVTGIVGGDKVLSDYSVNRLEPSKR